MRSTIGRIIILSACACISLTASAADIRLTDVTTFGASSEGSWFGQPNIWETRPGRNFNNWLRQGDSFVTGPTDAEAKPNITLAAGLNTFQIIGSRGIDHPNFGINLFFNDQITPSISALAPMLTDANQAHTFAANSNPGTPAPEPGFFENIVAGAGTLSFVVGDQLITLTDFYWASPSVYNLDLINEQTVGGDGVTDFVGGITLSVTPVPEPSVLALGGVAGLCVCALQWMRSRK